MPRGSPFTKKERRLRAELLGIHVDPQDEWLLEDYTWNITTRGYAQTTFKNPSGHPRQIRVYIHHMIVGLPLWPLEVDHEDRNKRNNCRYNLRYSTHSANMLNRQWIEDARNVHYDPYSGKYSVYIQRDNVIHTIGRFSSKHEAEQARYEYLSKHNL